MRHLCARRRSLAEKSAPGHSEGPARCAKSEASELDRISQDPHHIRLHRCVSPSRARGRHSDRGRASRRRGLRTGHRMGQGPGAGRIIDASSGDGRALRERLRGAVSQGMEKGHTTRQAGEFWRDLAQRFDPARPGRNERKVLLSRILSRAGPVDMIKRVTEALVAQGDVAR